MKAVKFIGLLILSNIFCIAAPAQSTGEKCVVRGWVRDAEPRKDIYIYNGPGQVNPFKPYDIIGHLDNSTEPGEEKPVEITGFKLHPRAGKWVRIRKATDLSGKALFEGDGWLPAERVSVGVRNSTGKPVSLFSGPRLTSKKIGGIPDNTTLPVTGFDCFGPQVRYKGRSGWVSAANICGSIDLTCGR